MSNDQTVEFFVVFSVVVILLLFGGYFGYKKYTTIIHADDYMREAVEELKGIRKALERG